MTLYNADLYFKDNASKYNQELTDFLKRNLDKIINKGRIKFTYNIVNPQDLPNLRKKGITGLPAMMINGKAVIGVPNIKEILRRRVQTSKKQAKKKTNDEALNDYLQDIIINSDDDNNEMDEKVDYNRLMQEAQEERAASFSHSPTQNTSPPKASRDVVLDMGHRQHNSSRSSNMPILSRDNNIEDVGDPLQTLKRMKSGGRGTEEDELLTTLFENMAT